MTPEQVARRLTALMALVFVAIEAVRLLVGAGFSITIAVVFGVAITIQFAIAIQLSRAKWS